MNRIESDKDMFEPETYIKELKSWGKKRGVVWRLPITCPECGKIAWYSSVWGYRNITNGYRIFCPHCGEASWSPY